MKSTGCYLLTLALVLGPVLQMCAAQNGGGECGAVNPSEINECVAKGGGRNTCGPNNEKCKGRERCCRQGCSFTCRDIEKDGDCPSNDPSEIEKCIKQGGGRHDCGPNNEKCKGRQRCCRQDCNFDCREIAP